MKFEDDINPIGSDVVDDAENINTSGTDKLFASIFQPAISALLVVISPAADTLNADDDINPVGSFVVSVELSIFQ